MEDSTGRERRKIKAPQPEADTFALRSPEDAAPQEQEGRPKLKSRPVGGKCPFCGTEVDKEAVLCVDCGYDFRTGLRQAAKRKSADLGPTPPARATPRQILLFGIPIALFISLSISGVWLAGGVELNEAAMAAIWMSVVLCGLVTVAAACRFLWNLIGLRRRNGAVDDSVRSKDQQFLLNVGTRVLPALIITPAALIYFKEEGMGGASEQDVWIFCGFGVLGATWMLIKSWLHAYADIADEDFDD